MANHRPASQSRLLSRFRRPRPFPRDFFFGVATSDHQCEAYEPKWEDVRDRWEKLNGRTPRGKATDFWNRWPEDVRRARELGCRAFRFSVAWARVEPEPGRFDDEVLRHYREMVDGVVAAGMKPIVTLHHFTWPLHVEDRGGMTAPGFPQWFADYAERVAEALGDGVGYWITFNEPTYLPFGFVKPWGSRGFLLPPGMAKASNDEQVRAAAALIRNLFLAHREARIRIHTRIAHAKVGTNPFVLGFPRWLQGFLDQHTTAKRDPQSWVQRERSKLKGYPDLVSGVIDVMFGAFARTAERERDMLFSEGYAEGQPALLVRADDPATTARDADGATVAALRGGSAVDVVSRGRLTLSVKWVRTVAQAREKLRRGEVRAIVGDDVLMRHLIEGDPARWKILPLEVPVHTYSAAVALNRESLLKEVDAAIREVVHERGESKPAGETRLASVGAAAQEGPQRVAASGPHEEEHDAPGPFHREGDPGQAKSPWLSSDAVSAVKRRGEVVVGVLRGGSPFAWRDEKTGRWTGLEADIARALARRLFGNERRVRFIPVDPAWRGGLLRSVWIRPLEFVHRVVTLFSTMANTDWWYLGMAGRLPAFLCPHECVGQMDFVGFDYYWGIPELRWDRLRALIDSIQAHYGSAPVHPGGIGRLIQRYTRMFPGKEIVIIENGCIDKADGVERAEYLRAHLWEVQKAIAAGAPIAGYVCWSITSNREWGLPFGPESDFGLFHVDLDGDPDLKRVPTPAAELFREIVRERDAVPTDGEALREWVRKFGLKFRTVHR